MNETNLNHFISNIYNFHYKTLKMYEACYQTD